MQKWQYGTVLYRHAANEQRAFIDCRGNELAMKDIDEVEAKLGLLRFIKAAGKQGWKLCFNLVP